MNDKVLFLYHYYESGTQPFRNLSDLSEDEAETVLKNIRKERPDTQCAKRTPEYLALRRQYEAMLRDAFLAKGGIMRRTAPHYLTLGPSPWLSTWYQKANVIQIPIQEFDLKTVSFTYGDSHPTFSTRVNDGKEYRKKLYFYEEILNLIEKYGIPQEWNDDGKFGPERYIEAQVWDDAVIQRYL